MSSRRPSLSLSLGLSRSALVAGLATLIACVADAGGDRPPSPDGGPADLGPLPEAGPVDLGVGLDGAPSIEDAGAPTECATDVCDPRSAVACDDEEVRACRIAPTGPLCGGAIGTGAELAPCAQSADCKPGLECFATADGGRCQRVCCGVASATGCGLLGRCSTGARLVDGTRAPGGWGRCVEPRVCDVLDPLTGCDPGEACAIVSGSGEVDCRIVGDAGVGEGCASVGDCAPGLFCAGLVERTCRRICALSDAGAGSCPEGEGVCRAYPYSPPGTGICSADAIRTSSR